MSIYQGSGNMERVQNVLNGGKFKKLSPARFDRSGLCVIILNLNKPEFIGPLLEQLFVAKKHFELQSIAFDICIGDTGSIDQDVLQLFERYQAQIKLKSDLNYHFSANNNEVFESFVNTTHVLFLNNDIRFESPESLWLLWQKLSTPNTVLGAYLSFENKRIQHAGVAFYPIAAEGLLPYHFASGESWAMINRSDKEVEAVTGAFLAMRSDLFLSCGGFTEDYLKECQDVDLCLKAKRLGAKVVIADLGQIVHFENGSRPIGEVHAADRVLLNRKWQSFVKAVAT